MTNLAYYLRPRGGACVIGVGGGRDLQAALLFGHERVVGVEVNPIIIDLHTLAGLRQNAATTPGEAEFKTDGPYGWVRHPIYSGWFLLVFATAPMTGTRLLFAVISTAYLIAAIPFEERSLLETHRQTYGAYQQQMRWRLIPFVW